jgi:hypothetical protein
MGCSKPVFSLVNQATRRTPSSHAGRPFSSVPPPSRRRQMPFIIGAMALLVNVLSPGCGKRLIRLTQFAANKVHCIIEMAHFWHTFWHDFSTNLLTWYVIIETGDFCIDLASSSTPFRFRCESRTETSPMLCSTSPRAQHRAFFVRAAGGPLLPQFDLDAHGASAFVAGSQLDDTSLRRMHHPFHLGPIHRVICSERTAAEGGRLVRPPL